MAIKFLSGQTISGTLTVSGNVQGATFNGLAINTTGTNNLANQIVRTDVNGYANFGWINSVSGNHTGSITRITASNDAYLRYVTPAQFRTGVTDGYYAPVSTVSGVTSVATTNGITGGTIISTGTIQVDSTVIRTTGGQTRTGNNVFAATSTATSYNNAAIEIREDNNSGATGTPPHLGFHWGGVVASQLTIESNGTIAVRDNPGTGYEDFKALNITATGVVYASGGNSGTWNSHTSNTGTVTSVAAGNGLAGGTITTTGTLSTVHLPSFDTRSVNPDPEDYANLIRFDFKANGTNGLSDGGGYNGQMTWRSYGSGSDLSGGQPIRLAYTANGNLWRQMGTSATSWGSWAKFALATGTSSQYIRGDGSIATFPTITGGTVTSVATGNGLTGGTITTSGTLSLDRPNSQLGAVLATYGTTAGASGRVRCTAPFNTNTGKMFSIEITLYGSYTQHNYVVSAYMYPTTNQWYLPKAIYTTTGTATPDIIVGRDANGKAYISIANANYTGVLVHNMTRGYQTSLADTYDPWTITIDAGTENSVGVSTSQVWTTANHTPGNYLPLAGGTMTNTNLVTNMNADLLDGQHGSYYFQTNITGNAATATTFSTGRTNYKGVTDAAVIGQMMWKNYGNNHTIFDASASTSPQGGSVNNTNSANAWTATYPTLMGWNGTSTYGVRVDSARIADSATVASNYLPLAGGTMSGNIAMGGASVTGAQDFSGTEFYATGWFRNSATNKGLYNSAHGNHFYADSGYWNIGYGGTTGLRLRNGHAGTIMGYLYGETSGQFGLLDKDQHWTFRTDGASVTELRTNNVVKFTQTTSTTTIAQNTTIQGQLTVGNTTSSDIYFVDTDENTRRMHCNSNRLGFLNLANSWSAYSDNAGNWIMDYAATVAGTLTTNGQITANSAIYLKDRITLPSSSLSSASGTPAYAIYQTPGAWTYPYPDLNIIMHTGIRMAANSGYGGFRFYSDYNTLGTASAQIMSINNSADGNGAGNVYINSICNAGASMRSPIFYDSNNTAYYGDFATVNSTSIEGVSNRTRAQMGITAGIHGSGSTYLRRPNYTTDTNYWTGAMGWSTVDMNTVASWGSGYIDSWGNPANQPSGSSHWVGTQAFHYSSGTGTAAKYGWQLVSGGSVGNLRFRQSWPTFTAWGTVPVLGVNNTSGGAMYAGSYYDSNNTAYYGDFASTSQLNVLNCAGTLTVTGAGGVIAPKFTDYNNGSFYLDPSSTGTSLNVAGDVVAYASSDIRFKNNITPITNALDKINKIGGYTFEWNEKSHKETGKKDIGVIAQEVEEILPEIVDTRDNGYKAVDYSKLTALLIQSVKEQQVIIDNLKSRIETLENN